MKFGTRSKGGRVPKKKKKKQDMCGWILDGFRMRYPFFPETLEWFKKDSQTSKGHKWVTNCQKLPWERRKSFPKHSLLFQYVWLMLPQYLACLPPSKAPWLHLWFRQVIIQRACCQRGPHHQWRSNALNWKSLFELPNSPHFNFLNQLDIHQIIGAVTSMNKHGRLEPLKSSQSPVFLLSASLSILISPI